MNNESNKKVTNERSKPSDLIENLLKSKNWITINENEEGVEIRTNKPSSIQLVADWLEADRELFNDICKYIKQIDDDEIAKSN